MLLDGQRWRHAEEIVSRRMDRGMSVTSVYERISLSLSAEMPRRTDDFRRGGGKEGRTATLPTNSFRSSGE